MRDEDTLGSRGRQRVGLLAGLSSSAWWRRADRRARKKGGVEGAFLVSFTDNEEVEGRVDPEGLGELD